MQLVVIFIILNVFQNCFIGRIKLLLENLRRRLLLENLSHALCISALFVHSAKIKKYGNYSLLFADVVLNHIIENAYQGIL